MLNSLLFRRAMLAVWICSVAATIYLSLLPGLELPVKFWSADKVLHLLGYAWLGALPLFALATGDTARRVAYCMIALGGLLEWGQSFVPGRASSLMDGVANAVGVFLGIWLAETILARCRGCQGLADE
ncbi:VanZ family protein [Solidesulfovibrio sp.]